MAAGTGTPTVVSAAIHFKKLPTRAALCEMIFKHVLTFDSLSGQPKNGRWQPVEFDVSKHLFFVDLPTSAELLPWMEETTVEPLANRESGPWWQIHAVTLLDSGEGVLLVMLEHACGDGIAMMQVLSRVATSLDGSPLPTSAYSKQPKEKVGVCATLCADMMIWNRTGDCCHNALRVYLT